MRDTISINRAYALHPKLRKEVIDTIDQIESTFPPTMAIRIVQGLRTFAEQDAIYAQGRTKQGPVVTNARGGMSFHNYGVAIDFVILYDKDGNGSFEALSWDINYDFDKDGVADWQQVVKAFKAKGWDWGGDWHSLKDNPHLQKTFGLTISQMLAKYNAQQFVESTSYIVL
jgi:peptidoglycan L-alanyl-D-glutamate endopeptidase CwlK